MARRIPLRVLLFIVGTAAAIGSIGTGMSSTLSWGILAAATLGSAIGGLHFLLRFTYAEYYGRMHLGSIRGLTIGSQIGGQVIGPVAAGFMYDISGSYRLPFLLLALAVIIGSLAVLAATPPKRNKTKES